MKAQLPKKIVLLSFLALLSIVGFSQTTYYYISGNPSTASNWDTNPADGGTNAANFTTANTTFVIPNGKSATLTAALTIGNNNNVTLQIDAGGTLTTTGQSLTIQGNLVNNGTLGGSGSITITGTNTSQSLSNATTTGSMFFSKTSGTAIFTGTSTAGSFTISSATAGTTATIQVDGTLDISGNINYTPNASGNLTRNFTGSGLIECVDLNIGSAITVNNIGVFPHLTTLNSSVAQLICTDDILMRSNNNNTNRFNDAQLIISGGIVDCDAFGVTNDIAGNTTLLQVTDATLRLANTSPLPNPTLGTFTRDFDGTGATVNYDGAAQTLFATTYTNLTLSGTGGKTFPTGTTTVNGTLTIENGANANTFTGSLSYGSTAALRYNTSSNRNTSSEWPTPFAGTGGVTISNTGVITLNGTRQLGLNVDLTIDNGASLSTNNNQLTFGGDFVNNGTFTAGSSAIIIANTGTQSIAGFTTTGTVSMTKTGGVATLAGAISSANLTINGVNGTLNLGTSLTHSVSTVTLTNGTLNGGTSSTLNVTGTSATAWTGTGSNFNAGTGGTVIFSGAAQTLTTASTFNNLTFSGSGTKTLNGVPTVNGVLSIELTSAAATISATPTFGAAATLRYNTSTSRTAGAEWPGTFSGSGGVVIDNTATITANNAKQVNTGSLNIASGATLDMSTFALSGSFTPAVTGTLKTSSTDNPPIPSGKIWTGNVQFTSSVDNQYIPEGTFSGTLTVDGGTVKFLVGNVTVSTLQLTAGIVSLEDDQANSYTLKITSQITKPVSGGTINGANNGILEFANTSSPLTIPKGTFLSGVDNLKISGGQVVKLDDSYEADISVRTLTTTGTGSYFDMNGYTLTIISSVSMSSGNGIRGSLKTAYKLDQLNNQIPSGSGLSIGGSKNLANIGTLYFDQTTPGTTNSLYNLNIITKGGGSLFLGNTVQVRNTFSPPADSLNGPLFTFNADSNLVIASRSTYTGRIDKIYANFAFGGKVIVERYIKNKTARRYVFLASPVDGISIRNGWQDDIYITSPANGGTPCSTTSAKYNDSGYDATTRKLVTIFTYNQPLRKWDSVVSPTTTTLLQKGIGYRVYYRGSRKADSTGCSGILESNSGGVPDSAIMNVYGTPTSGDVTVNIYGRSPSSIGTTSRYGYTLIGNPYACELDFVTFASNNASAINPTYWTHDPQASSTTGYLAYNNGSIAGGTGNVKTSGVITGANGGWIASGQAFMVQNKDTTGASATVTFMETQKTASQQLGVFRGTSINTWDSRIRINYLNPDTTSIDDVLVRFSDDPTVTTLPSDYWDVVTLNTTQFIGTIKSNRTFAIQTRPLDFYNDTVMVRVVSNVQGNYILGFSEFDAFTEADQIILIDQFTGTKTDVKANKFYPFTVTSSSASQGGRFLLVFRSKASVLPVSFLGIAATAKNEGAEVKWKVAFEQNIENYNVERSENGRDFTVIATVSSKGNSSTAVEYSYFDAKAIAGTVYYRVRSNEKSGEKKYTAVVKLNSSKETLISLYPNPVKDNLQIQVSNPDSYKRATILIRNAQGKTVLQQIASSTAGKMNLNVSSLAAGMYVITVTNDKGESVNDKLIKN
jgi:hypothetical protein